MPCVSIAAALTNTACRTARAQVLGCCIAQCACTTALLCCPSSCTHPDAVDGLQVEGGDATGGVPEWHVGALGGERCVCIFRAAVQVQHLEDAHLQDGVDMIQSLTAGSLLLQEG
jgi:hypothetical protein